MEFRVEAAIPRTAGEVWSVLVDIPKVASCIPGCEEVEERTRLADYAAVLRQKLGPFKIALPATITVQEVREPNWLQAVAYGNEKFTGTRIEVTLRMDLRDTEPGHSRMVAECDMRVAGKLASLGYSVIKKKAEENFAEFRTRLLKVMEECPVLQVEGVVVVPPPEPVEALVDATTEVPVTAAAEFEAAPEAPITLELAGSAEAPRDPQPAIVPEPALAPVTQA